MSPSQDKNIESRSHDLGAETPSEQAATSRPTEVLLGYLRPEEEHALGLTTSRITVAGLSEIPQNLDFLIAEATRVFSESLADNRIDTLIRTIDVTFVDAPDRTPPLNQPDEMLFREEIKLIDAKFSEQQPASGQVAPRLLFRYCTLAGNLALDVHRMLALSMTPEGRRELRILDSDESEAVRYHPEIRATMLLVVSEFMNETNTSRRNRWLKALEAVSSAEPVRERLYPVALLMFRSVIGPGSDRAQPLRDDLQPDQRAASTIDELEPDPEPTFGAIDDLRDRLIGALTLFDVARPKELRQLVSVVLRYLTGLSIQRKEQGSSRTLTAAQRRTPRDSGLQQLFDLLRSTMIEDCGGTREGVSERLNTALKSESLRHYLTSLSKRLEFLRLLASAQQTPFETLENPLQVVYSHLSAIVQHFLESDTFDRYEFYDHYREVISHSNAPKLEKDAAKKWYRYAFPDELTGGEIRRLLAYHHLYPRELGDEQLEVMFHAISVEQKIKILLQKRRELHERDDSPTDVQVFPNLDF